MEEIKNNSQWWNTMEDHIDELSVWISNDIAGWTDAHEEVVKKHIDNSIKEWVSMKMSEESIQIIKQ